MKEKSEIKPLNRDVIKNGLFMTIKVDPLSPHPREGTFKRTKLMSRYIGSGQRKHFHMGIQELVSKV